MRAGLNLKPIDFFDLKTRETPREIIEADFPRLGKLPISGGWGYGQPTACFIDKDDPCVDPNMPFDGVAIEHVFAERRLYEEQIVFRPKDFNANPMAATFVPWTETEVLTHLEVGWGAAGVTELELRFLNEGKLEVSA